MPRWAFRVMRLLHRRAHLTIWWQNIGNILHYLKGGLTWSWWIWLWYRQTNSELLGLVSRMSSKIQHVTITLITKYNHEHITKINTFCVQSHPGENDPPHPSCSRFRMTPTSLPLPFWRWATVKLAAHLSEVFIFFCPAVCSRELFNPVNCIF